jgi:hypothetical protein
MYPILHRYNAHTYRNKYKFGKSENVANVAIPIGDIVGDGKRDYRENIGVYNSFQQEL